MHADVDCYGDKYAQINTWHFVSACSLVDELALDRVCLHYVAGIAAERYE